MVTAIELGFPFNEQLPTVARVDQPYDFTIANSTYRTYTGNSITYQANNLPSWLLFDSSSRTFSGTPSSDDVGTFDIELVGNDGVDTISETYSMIVSDDLGLELSSGNVMFVQISQYGRTNGVDGLVVQEGDQIDLRFNQDVFKSKLDSERPIIAYYGRSADRSSLPNWITFNSDDMSFTGTVPHVISREAPSFEYGFSFIGSDYYGYAGAEGLFKIVVGGHQLSTNINETIKVNGTFNREFDIEVPVFSNVFLDGSIISQDNISSVEPQNLPDYITFNQDSYTLTGNFPDDSTFDNFTITIRDVFSNQVELPYSFDSIGSVFTVRNLPSVNATRGEYFEYELMDSLFTDVNDTEIDTDFSADWLQFHSSNNTFTGLTPDDFDQVSVEVDASSGFGTESKSFRIRGIDGDEESSSSESSSSSSSSESSSESSSSSASSSSSTASSSSSAAAVASQSKSTDNNRKKLAIGLGVGIPLLLILLAGLIFFCCCFKRRKNNDEEAKSGDTTLEDEEEITGPGFGEINQSPTVLAASNVKKLENDEIVSTSSSMTHVENDSDGSHYFDADDDIASVDETGEKPMKSWRANDNSDVAKAVGAGLTTLGNVRKSDASLSTVNTDKLFSVRLVEDQSMIRNSQQSSFGSGQFISNNSLNALLNREDSGNIQRLDSDGNIVDKTSETSYSPRKQLSRSPSANLGVLVEHSYENNDSKDYSTNKNSLYDDFKATQNVDGDYDWLDSRSSMDQYRYLNNGQTINMSVSDNTIATNDTNPRISSTSLGKTAKLVDFTRRSSLRESAQNLHHPYEGESVQIHNDSD